MLVPKYNWDSIPEHEVAPGLRQKVFRGDNLLVSRTVIQPEAQTKPHSHPWEQLFMITEGTMQIEIEGELHDCPPGTVIRIPPDAHHHAHPPKPGEDPVVNLDIFYPLREEFAVRADYQTDVFSAGAVGGADG